MRTKLNEPVNNAGEITTINELDKRGLIFFEKSERFQTKRGISTKYFAVVKGTDTKEGIRSGWEIGKTAYLSKTKQAIDNGFFKKAIQFNAKYYPHIGLKAQKVIDGNNIAKIQKPKAQSSTNKPTLVKQGDVRLVIDFSTIFKNINEWQNTVITTVNFNNQKYFKVSGKIKRFSFTLWINALNYYVSKSILYIDNKIYAETTLQYKHISNQYWLPVNLMYMQYPTGTQVTQNFSSYLFK